eukprot:765103-Hanusia_phi.AAC.3
MTWGSETQLHCQNHSVHLLELGEGQAAFVRLTVASVWHACHPLGLDHNPSNLQGLRISSARRVWQRRWTCWQSDSQSCLSRFLIRPHLSLLFVEPVLHRLKERQERLLVSLFLVSATKNLQVTLTHLAHEFAQIAS